MNCLRYRVHTLCEIVPMTRVRPSTYKLLPVAAMLCALMGTSTGSWARDAQDAGGSVSATQAICAVPAGTISLQQALELALCNQPLTAEASALVREARAARDQAQGAQLPQATLSSSLNKTLTHLSGNADGMISEQQGSLSYVLFDFGAQRATTAAAQAGVRASERDAQAQAQTVMLEASKRYFALVAAREAVRAAQDNLSAAQASDDSVQARFQVGDAIAVDVLQSQSNVAEARMKVAQAQGNFDISRAALAQYVGAKLSAAIEPELPEEQPPELVSIEDMLAGALANRPDLQAARERVAAAQSQVDLARAAGKPQLKAEASWAYQHTPQYYYSGHTNSIGLTLEIPLFDGGQAKARENQARAHQTTLEARLQQQVDAVELDVVQAYAQLRAAHAARTSALAFKTAAQGAEEQAHGRYDAGVGTMLEWLTLQAKVASAREQAISADVTWFEAKLALAHALGSLETSSH